MQQEEIEIQLWEFIDGTCSSDDRERIARLIANDATWKTIYNNLLSFHSSLQTGIKAETAPAQFTDKVMGRLSANPVKEPAKHNLLNWGIRLVASVLIILFIITTVYTIGSSGLDIRKIHFTKKLNFSLPDIQTFSANTGLIAGFVMVMLLLAIADKFFRQRRLSTD